MAEDCPRGDLDSRFCDRDGDLVADASADPSKWIDPDILYLAYPPIDDPGVYKAAWSDFMTHMEKVTGKKVRYFVVQSNAVQVQAMRSQRLHVAGFSTGSVLLAVNCASFVAFVSVTKPDGKFGYEMGIFTYPGSGIDKVEDNRGRKLVFTTPTSNSGFKAPSAILKAEFDMIVERDFEPVFSGKHSNSIIGVANKNYEAATIAIPMVLRMINRGAVKAEDVLTIYQSKTFPNTGIGYVYNLHPDLKQKVREAFFSFEWDKPDGTPTSLKVEFGKSNHDSFMSITFKEHWAIIRTIDQANEVSYDCQ
jgi:phosphonate transport system substrate-binding protein